MTKYLRKATKRREDITELMDSQFSVQGWLTPLLLERSGRRDVGIREYRIVTTGLAMLAGGGMWTLC